MASILSDSEGDGADGVSPRMVSIFSDSDGDDALERPTKRRHLSAGDELDCMDGTDSEIDIGGLSPAAISSDTEDSVGDELDCMDEEDSEMDIGGVPSATISSGASMGLRELRPFQWALGVVRCLGHFLGVEKLRDSLLLGGFSFTTHFSGVGTAERSVQCLMAACPPSGLLAACPSLMWSCEKRHACRLKLLCLPGDSCVFTDILDISPDSAELFHRLKAAKGQQLDFETEWRKLRARGVAPQCRECQAHGAQCFRLDARPDVDISGSPCEAWSSMGKRKGASSHQTVLFLVWARWVRAACPLVLIHENVMGFKIDLFEKVLGDLYEVVRLAVKPCHAAFQHVKRPRAYFVLFLKGKVKVVAALSPLYQQISGALAQLVPTPSLRDIAIASPDQLLAEENAARKGRRLAPLQEPSKDWEYLLTEKQKARLHRYTEAASPPGGDHVFDLGQNAEWSRSATALPTLTTKSARMWFRPLRRWFLPVELAYAHGFPVAPHAARDANVEVDSNSYTVCDIGGSMHMASVGAALAIALSCVQRK